jgi:hypothetical protein
MDASNPPQSTTKNAPHLHSVATSLRSCLDGMLPDDLRNDTTAFQEHCKNVYQSHDSKLIYSYLRQ